MRGRENEKRASEFERQGQKKFKRISKNLLTNSRIYDIITTKTGEGKPHKPERDFIMKKLSMETIVNYIDTHNVEELFAIKDELTAELAKGKAKADANRAIYEEIHDAVIATLKSATAPVTAQELADETGYAKGKIVYGLTNYWGDEVVKTEGKVNTYALKA